MDHPAQLSWALAPKPVWPYRGPLSTSGIENLRDGAFRKDRPAFRIEIGNDGWSWPTGAPTTTAAELARLGLRGKALDDALRSQASRHLRLASLIEQLPDPENRVTLDPRPYGHLRRAAATHRLPPRRLCAGRPRRRPRCACVRSSAQLGATEIQHRDPAEGAGHIIGTARMGNDPKAFGGRPRSAQPRPS